MEPNIQNILPRGQMKTSVRVSTVFKKRKIRIYSISDSYSFLTQPAQL